MKKCFSLARKAQGNVSPNPLVGAVLLKNGKVIGQGWHKKYGREHAEVNAIKNATEDVAGSTLYCNLEPCCHTKKQTPPCVPLLIQNKIKRVVISNLDPNKDVDGKGLQQLIEAGIEVISGILEDDGKELNKFYFKFVQDKLPFVTLKIAQSIDGKISEAKNKQTWLTGKEAIKYVHKLRSEYDAVLVGANTIKIDNPQLNVREAKGRNPIRIIIDGRLSIPLQSQILNPIDPEKTWIFTKRDIDEKKVKRIADRGIKIFSVNSKQNHFNLKKILRVLADNKITSLLVEGGADIFTQFLQKDLFDEIIVLQAPKILGRGINGFNIHRLKKILLLKMDNLGKDIRLVYGRKLSD
ncbi:MAG: bifunctional diaminohydroxyphosphoribosylaminopyrimidine deaminase/5-amino-6-(5-phosphoribosylamino)uracil reductase RibD [Ignavibacteriaceae bacterium]|nr:bifunctional diaminohydroxyphosphoribosylaminopyrimidine deaminase/5-amino-6-(5-phosphoribosylamino)uracil reductase RibD [Ignavibacteriaceae bacterium]